MWPQLPRIKHQSSKYVTAQEPSIFQAAVSGKTLPVFSMERSPYNPVFQIPLRLLSNCKVFFHP